MCLFDVKASKLNLSGVGYKIVALSEDSFLRGLYRLNYKYNIKKINKAEKFTIEAEDSNYYDSGFHIFLNKSDAKSLLFSNNLSSNNFRFGINLFDINLLAEVYFRNGHTIGHDRGLTVVANEMYFKNFYRMYNSENLSDYTIRKVDIQKLINIQKKNRI